MARWVALRVEPAALFLVRAGELLRRARQWPWYALALYLFAVARYVALPRGAAYVVSLAGVLAFSAGLLVALKR